MANNTYVIHLPLADPDNTPPTIPPTVSNLITRVSEFYRFLGVDDNNITTKYFCNSAIVTGILFLSPSPRVSINFLDRTRIIVDARNVNIEPLFT